MTFLLNVQEVSAQQDAVILGTDPVSLIQNSSNFKSSPAAQTALMAKVNSLRMISPLNYSGVEEITVPLRISYLLAIHEILESGTRVEKAIAQAYSSNLLPASTRYKSSVLTGAILDSIVNEAITVVSQ